MEKNRASDLADDVSPARAYQLGKMVAAMVEAGFSETVNLALDTNLRAFRSGIKAGLKSTTMSQPARVGLGADLQPKRKLRVKAKVGHH